MSRSTDRTFWTVIVAVGLTLFVVRALLGIDPSWWTVLNGAAVGFGIAVLERTGATR